MLRRDEHTGQFVLTSVLVQDNGTVDDAVRQAVDGCSWDLQVARTMSTFGSPSSQALARLRAFDPHHAFLPAPTETSGPQ